MIFKNFWKSPRLRVGDVKNVRKHFLEGLFLCKIEFWIGFLFNLLSSKTVTANKFVIASVIYNGNSFNIYFNCLRLCRYQHHTNKSFTYTLGLVWYIWSSGGLVWRKKWWKLFPQISTDGFNLEMVIFNRLAVWWVLSHLKLSSLFLWAFLGHFYDNSNWGWSVRVPKDFKSLTLHFTCLNCSCPRSWFFQFSGNPPKHPRSSKKNVAI